MNFADLLRELKRRKVFRVAGVYAVVAFVVVQVADIVFPALHLPAWTVTLVVALALLGFPIALVLAWALEVTPDGVKRTQPAATPTPQETAESASDSRRLAIGLITGFCIAVGGLGAYGWMTSDRPGAASDGAALDPHRVAVFPFAVRGAEDLDYLGESMVELLGRSLDGAGPLRTVDPHALLSRVTRHSTSGPLSPDDAGEIAAGFGAGRYVLGTIVRVGDGTRLSASWYGEGGEPLGSTEVVAAAEGEIQSTIDALARSAIGALVAEAGDGLDRREGLAAQTTSSVEALKAYLEGQAATRRSEFDEAWQSFQRAVEADSTFALAHYRLGIAARWIGAPGFRDSAARAVELAGGLPERDRRLMQAFEAFVEDRGSEAEEIYRLIIEDDPHDVEAWNNLGLVLFFLGPGMGRPATEARVPLMTALDLDPTLSEPIFQLVRIAGMQRDRALLDSITSGLEHRKLDSEVEAMLRTIRTDVLGDGSRGDIDLNSLVTVDFAAEILRFWGLFDEAKRLLRTLTAHDRAEGTRSHGHRSTSAILALQGRFREAQDELEDHDVRRQAEMSAAWALFLADHERGREALAGLLPRAEAQTPEGREETASDLAWLGWLRAATGNAEAALDTAARLAEMEALEIGWTPVRVRDAARQIRAEVEIQRERPDRALEILETKESPSPFGRFRQAELLAEGGRLEEALGWYETLDMGSGVFFAAPAYLGRARVLERLDRPEEATDAYERFLEMWSDADEPLRPMVQEARQRLEHLTGEGGRAINRDQPEDDRPRWG